MTASTMTRETKPSVGRKSLVTTPSIVKASILTSVLVVAVTVSYLWIGFVVIHSTSSQEVTSSTSSSSSHASSISTSSSSLPEGPTVRTTSGRIRGRFVDVLGSYKRKLSVFQGIPYATPPIGSLRFSRPEPVIRWRGILDATKPSPVCLQFTSDSIELPWIQGREKVPESEDCLKLNIWTPVNDTMSRPATGTRPVMVWIHGGGFVSGHSRMTEFDGGILASYTDSVVVTFNYRVGLLGFLNIHDTNINGNMGLYDQVMALEWIKDNIQFFGGNPALVTLFGESAGAACVGFHTMSPLSRDLINRGIMQSGSPLMPISLVTRSQEDIVANDVLKMTGCRRGNDDDILKCLQEKPTSELLKIQSVIVKRKDDTTFGPTFGDDFLPENPFDGIKLRESFGNQSKDILLGYNRDEGSVFMYFANPNQYPAVVNSTRFNGTRLTADVIGQLNLSMESLTSFAVKFMKTQDPSATSVLMKSLYAHVNDSSPGHLFNETRINVGEFFIVCPTILAADDYSRLSNTSVYFYHFSHRPKNTPWAEWVGAAHFEEVQFVFGLPLRYPNRYTKDEVKLSKKIMTAWTTFARTGRPDVGTDHFVWPKYDAESGDRKYVDVSGKGLRIRTNPPNTKCDMWRLTFEVSRSTITTTKIEEALNNRNSYISSSLEDDGESSSSFDTDDGDEEGEEEEKIDATTEVAEMLPKSTSMSSLSSSDLISTEEAKQPSTTEEEDEEEGDLDST